MNWTVRAYASAVCASEQAMSQFVAERYSGLGANDAARMFWLFSPDNERFRRLFNYLADRRFNIRDWDDYGRARRKPAD